MLLNLLLFEGADPEFLIRRSFYQFQLEKQRPQWDDKIATLEVPPPPPFPFPLLPSESPSSGVWHRGTREDLQRMAIGGEARVLVSQREPQGVAERRA